MSLFDIPSLLGLSYKYERTFCEAKHETSSVFKIGRSAGTSTPCRSASDWQFQIFTVWALLGRFPPIDLPVTGNFRFLLYELLLADQVADVPPPIEHRSNWTPVHQISWYVLAHIGRSSGRSTPLQLTIDPLNTTTPKWQIYPPVDLPVHLNGNFTFLL